MRFVAITGPATFTPIETADGRRYKVEGRIATGALLQALPHPQRGRPQGDSKLKPGFLTLPSDFANLAPILEEPLRNPSSVSNPLVPSLTPSWCRVTAT
jgi:hypothetical protein